MAAETVRTETKDGAMEIYRVAPQGNGPFPALIVIQEAFGVNDHIQDVARRFAEQGYLTFAPDLFHRLEKRVYQYAEFKEAMAALGTITPDSIATDVSATLDFVEKDPAVQKGKVGIIGYCMGGLVAFFSATQFSDRLSTAVSYYGGGIVGSDPNQKAPIDFADQIRIPVLCFFGGNDPFIPEAAQQRVKETLAKLGPQHEVVIYPQAGHGFFCDARPQSYNEEAAKDAWRRTLEWLKKNLAA